VAISNLVWDGGGYDLHLLAGETSAPLKPRLGLTRENESGRTFLSGSDLPNDVAIVFHPEFKGVKGADQKYRGHGVIVDTATGAVEVKVAAVTATPRLYNFLIRAEAKDTKDGIGSSVRIRVHVHKRIEKIWLTPRTLIVHQGATNQRFTVLAEFDDGTNGDITGWRGLSYSSNKPHVAKVDSATGLVTHVADGSAKIRVKTDASAVSLADDNTADVETRPSLAVDRAVVRVRPRGPVAFNSNVNILFLPDGFTAAERGDFFDIVQWLTYQLQTKHSTYPFNLLKGSINYWRLADNDFLASVDKDVSIQAESAILSNGQRADSLPFPVEPPAAGDWTLGNMVFKVGLPVPADSSATLQAKLVDWNALYDGVVSAPITQQVFDEWLMLHTRKLLNERCTALGFRLEDHPRADENPGFSSLSLDPRRVAPAQFRAMISKLSKSGDVVGTTWVEWGKDEGLVCVIARNSRLGGMQSGDGYFSISVRAEFDQAVQAAAPLRGIDLVNMALPQGSPLPVDEMIPVIVAHEVGHAFGLGEEYGDGAGRTLPAHREIEMSDAANAQPASQVHTPTVDPARIKWDWPRLSAAGKLTAEPEPTGTGAFFVHLEVGHRAQFALGDAVKLRGRGSFGLRFIVPPSEAFSGWLRITGLEPTSPNRVIVRPDPGVSITPSNFFAGSMLVRPKRRGEQGLTFNLIAPVISEWLKRDLPLNRTNQACIPAVNPPGHQKAGTPNPFKDMPAANLPPGLPPDRPKNKQNIVGIYDGGHYHDCGVYHPTGLCLMRTGGDRSLMRSARFCQVCRYVIVDAVDSTKHGELDALYEKTEYPEPP
jgi:hypothetical protein